MISQSDVTIIIPTLNRTDDQKRAFMECIKSLNETIPEMKKIIVINGLDFQSDFDLWGEVDKKTTSIMTLEEQGQCKAVNAAIATINTPWIFITNDDMIYAPGWWEKLTDLSWFGKEEIKAISPMLIEPRSGAPTFIIQFFGGAGGDFNKQSWLEYAKNWNVATSGKWKTGFNFPLLIKRKLWNTIEGYDINYDPWGSNGDSDLEYKIKLAGIQPYQNTNCIVYHFSQTSGTFEPKNDSYRFKNYAYFKEKWGFDRTDNGIWEADFKIPTKEEGRIYFPEWENKYTKQL